MTMILNVKFLRNLFKGFDFVAKMVRYGAFFFSVVLRRSAQYNLFLLIEYLIAQHRHHD
jgi:hypothetical protein